MKKTTAILAALLMGPSLSVFSQGNSPGNPDDPIARTTRLAQTISDLTARINSDDAAIRAAAIEIALRNESPTVRGMALAAALNRFHTLTPEFIVERENPIEPGDLPNISIRDIRWSPPDMHSFYGNIVGNNAHGEVTHDQLSITFTGISVASNLYQRGRQIQPNPPLPPPQKPTDCRVTLRLNDSRTSLEGNLQCNQVSRLFRIRLGFLG